MAVGGDDDERDLAPPGPRLERCDERHEPGGRRSAPLRVAPEDVERGQVDRGERSAGRDRVEGGDRDAIDVPAVRGAGQELPVLDDRGAGPGPRGPPPDGCRLQSGRRGDFPEGEASPLPRRDGRALDHAESDPDAAEVPGGAERRAHRRQAERPDPLERANPVPGRGDSRREVRPDLRGRSGSRRPPARRAPVEEGPESVPGAASTAARPETVDRHDDHASRTGRREGRRRGGGLPLRREEQRRDRERGGRGHEKDRAPPPFRQPSRPRKRASEVRRAGGRPEEERRQGDRQTPEERRFRPLRAEPPRGEEPEEKNARRGREAENRRSASRPAGAAGRREEEGREADGRQECREEEVDEEKPDRAERPAVAELRRGHGGRRRERQGENPDRENGKDRAGAPSEPAPEDEPLDPAPKVTELPQARPRLLERQARRRRGAQARRSRTNRVRSARTAPRRRKGTRAATAVSRSSPTSSRLDSAPSTTAKFARCPSRRVSLPSRAGSPSRSRRSSVI